MAYNSPYQPDLDRDRFRQLGMRAGKSVLENLIIYGAQAIKFVVQFIIDAIKSVLGQ